MKKTIISAIISFILGILGGGFFVNSQNSTTINHLKAEIIKCENTNIGTKIEARGGQGTGDVTGLSVTTKCQSEQDCTGFSVNMNAK